MRHSSKLRYVNLAGGGQQQGGFLGRVIALLIGCVAFAVSVVVGAVFLAGLLGFLVIGGTVFMLRVWWLRRQMDKGSRAPGDIEGQYTVIREQDSGTFLNGDDGRP
jgi:hypothetical protein